MIYKAVFREKAKEYKSCIKYKEMPLYDGYQLIVDTLIY